MTYYGGKDLADSFRTVRKNTIQVAKDLPEEHYGFRATPEVESVGAMLAHIAIGTVVPLIFHGTERKTFFSVEDWQKFSGDVKEKEAALTSKALILEALEVNGQKYAAWLETLDDATLGELVGFPPPITPSQQSRFAMLLGVKEHEMHHRAKLMLIERLLGIVPHLTRARQARA
jgi:uncharacterized damage-inducible protein DinB